MSDVFDEAPENGYDYDESRMVPGAGYSANSSTYIGAALKGLALAQAVSGCTIVLTLEVTSMASLASMSMDFFDPPAWSTDWNFTMNNGFGGALAHLRDGAIIDIDPGALVSGTNKVAVTFSADELAVSLNSAGATAIADPATPNPPTAVEFGTNKTNFRFVEMAIYDPPASHSALAELSSL